MKRTLTASAGRTAVVVLLSTILFTAAGRAADLKPETIKAWEQYIEEKETEVKSSARAPLIAPDDDRNFWTQMRSGKILVVPAGPNIPRRVPSGLIHDWIGTAFIPDATLPQVLAAIRDYDGYKNMYRPGVVDSRACMAMEDEDTFSLLLVNRSFFGKTALEGDFRAKYFRVDERRWYSILESTRIQEIVGYGGADARLLPEGEGSALIWRAASITRYEERDEGVVVQFEAMALSRDIPGALRWVIDPVVRRVSRESVQLSLQKTRDAVESNRPLAIGAQNRQRTGVNGSEARRCSLPQR
ncbi:MAG TPA: hypothetical protein VIY49_39505 [Bryobacteraceae bacterium]